MASPFSLSKSGKGKSGSAEYQKLLQTNMKRYKDRDEAVRKTNIATGHGSSTAQRFMHEGATRPKSGGGAGKSTDRRKTSSTKRKGNFSLPKEAPIPTPRSFGSPDLAVSPPHEPDNMRGAPTDLSLQKPVLQPRSPLASPSVSPLSPPVVQPLSPPVVQPQSSLASPSISPLPAPSLSPLPQPVVGSGGPVGAGRPPVGMGGPVGAGNPLFSTPPADDNASWIRKLLGLA